MLIDVDIFSSAKSRMLELCGMQTRTHLWDVSIVEVQPNFIHGWFRVSLISVGWLDFLSSTVAVPFNSFHGWHHHHTRTHTHTDFQQVYRPYRPSQQQLGALVHSCATQHYSPPQRSSKILDERSIIMQLEEIGRKQCCPQLMVQTQARLHSAICSCTVTKIRIVKTMRGDATCVCMLRNI